ncbi:hypothetical protein sscle_04g038270 [Sclerotinia sclerotiorum 1980 UF-70]|uniref:Uncharacterized protein n=1 Tax=Sclerotinia sclerotiorum (strain ATCC 18683 / 1980 / Ss-1) TaxID=665079 RepID=A0A1D9Q298_SCLS1|nr:hypothetical protein sscle_04g038270 [Sclerotinia sclerotiorum 1980 UF-70]
MPERGGYGSTVRYTASSTEAQTCKRPIETTLNMALAWERMSHDCNNRAGSLPSSPPDEVA